MKFLKKFLTILALGATGLTAFSQTNIVLNGTQPYYNITNIVMTGAGTLIAGDWLQGNQTFSYLNGTNNLGQPIQPVGVARSRFVSFGLNVTTTNSSGKNYGALIQGSTGFGDWANLTNLVVATGVAGTTTNTYSTNALVDTGGLILFRCASATNNESATTNATGTVSFSSKPGI